MKVTQVALRPTEASETAGRPALTPELLAATGARYSRNNEGLEAILAQIDPQRPDASVDRIFRFVDYGHASIADMAPVALFIDGISLFAAYYLWTLCPVGGGQESSTRYIRLGEEGLVSAEELEIPEAERASWQQLMQSAFAAYRQALTAWESVSAAVPDIARIPRSLQEDSSDRAKKAVARMRRNYAFDRARYFLPVASRTNMMLVQSARAWVSVCQTLLSHPLLEIRRLGEHIQTELALATPRLLRHAAARTSSEQGIYREFTAVQQLSEVLPLVDGECAPRPFLDILPPPGGLTGGQAAGDLSGRENRYAYIGEGLRRTAVRFGWAAVAFAEIRDLNRHRTGTKYCPFLPVGFYHATEQWPAEQAGAAEYRALGAVGQTANQSSREQIKLNSPTYVYHLLLGSQFPFEHTTTADKFLYEGELRTGTGAHFRYAQHLHDVLVLWYERYPETRGLVLEGSGEPE